MKAFLTSVVLLFACLTRVHAWNAEGHMVVAQLAYNHLDSVVKTRCDALIGVPLATNLTDAGTADFVTAAVWADVYRSTLGSAIWHYIDIPISLDGTATNGVTADPFDVVKAINQCVAVLQNTNNSATNRATCLRYLIHFVGDIQQPLHCVAAVWSTRTGGDAGGNAYSISSTNGWSNLHSLWDDGGGFLQDPITNRPLTTVGQSLLSNKVYAAESAYPFTDGAGTLPDPMLWALEGKALAQTNTYVGIARNSTTTTNQAYLNKVMATTNQRMAIGGKRLADLLNTIFAPVPVALTPQLQTNGFRFSWASTNAFTYRVQSKTNLTEVSWTDVTDVLASGTNTSYTNTPSAAQKFYRVVGVN